MAFREESRGTVDLTGETVPPGVRWAGELIAARAADDEAAFGKVLESCADDAEFGKFVGDLLTLIATNLRPVAEASRQVRASREGGTP